MTGADGHSHSTATTPHGPPLMDAHSTSTAKHTPVLPRFSLKPLQGNGNEAHDHNHAHNHSHGQSGHSHQHGPRCSHNATAAAPLAVVSQPAVELTPLEELFQCAKTNQLERFREILNEHESDTAALVQQRDVQGHTLAHWVAQRGSTEFLELLGSLGAPLDLPSDDAVKLHPIHWACSTGNLAALKTFVKMGVDINTCDVTKQRTPLLIAAQNGFPLLVMYCVKHGADVNLVDIDDDSAIHWAAYKGATEIVSVFQYLGLSTDHQDRYGQTPLHLAAMRGEYATVQYLVEELESDLNVLDANGRTPYQLAKLKGFDRVAKYLSRRQFRAKWNVFAWWESSRAPYYFVLVNIPVSLLAYVRLLMPAMPELRALYVLHLLWNAVVWSLFFLTTRTSPGDLSRDTRCKTEYTHVTEQLVAGDDSDTSQLCLLERPLCHSCHIQRPLRAKHCRVCKTCVHTFDHHCPFVDNCVGRNNYVYFMGFVGGMVLNLVLLEYVLYLQWRAHGLAWWLVLFVLYGVVMLLPVAHLFGFHCYLTAKNLTTNEVVNTHRYQYLRNDDGTYRNPFDNGLLLNFVDRCLPTEMSSSATSALHDLERRGFLADSSSSSSSSTTISTTGTTFTKHHHNLPHDVAASPV